MHGRPFIEIKEKLQVIDTDDGKPERFATEPKSIQNLYFLPCNLSYKQKRVILIIINYLTMLA